MEQQAEAFMNANAPGSIFDEFDVLTSSTSSCGAANRVLLYNEIPATFTQLQRVCFDNEVGGASGECGK